MNVTHSPKGIKHNPKVLNADPKVFGLRVEYLFLIAILFTLGRTLLPLPILLLFALITVIIHKKLPRLMSRLTKNYVLEVIC